MNFGRSMFTGTNDTPRFDMLGDAVGAAEDLVTKNEIMGDARRDAAQSFANARIDAAKKGLASAQSAASTTMQNAFVGAAGNAVLGGLQGGFSEGGIFNQTPRPDMNTPIPGVNNSGFGGSGSLTGARGDTFGSFGTFNNNNGTVQFGGYGSSGFA